MKEIETRILDVNVDEIRHKLKNLQAEKVKMENQINVIFDFPDRKLLSNKGYARIRKIQDQLNNKDIFYMTTKKLISQEKYKVMDENEVEIDNGEIGENIFKALGLEVVETIHKYRESYKLKDALIEIDINDKSFCPFPYIEIETSDEDSLKEVVELLGYTMKDTNSKTIYEILAERGIERNTKGI